jgi:hypothetical protein
MRRWSQARFSLSAITRGTRLGVGSAQVVLDALCKKRFSLFNQLFVNDLVRPLGLVNGDHDMKGGAPADCAFHLNLACISLDEALA